MHTPSNRSAPIRALCRTLLVAAFALSATGMTAAATGTQCSTVVEEFQTALAARNLDDAIRRYEALRKEPTCDDKLRYRGGKALSALHAMVAQERLDKGESLESVRPMLEESLKYGRTWPVLALAADAAHDASDFDRASDLYQDALTMINDEELTENPPPVSEIEHLVQLAKESWMLASVYRPVPRLPSGAPAGLAAKSIRGKTINNVPIPITFHIDSAEFTDNGHRAAADLAAILEYEAPDRITIVGHTDETGSKEHNLELSRERAEAVARYLIAQGFQGAIEKIAMGESQRFAVADPSIYSREERLQMDRRVELLR